MKSPINRNPWALLAAAGYVALSTMACGGPPDDIGEEQMRSAIEHQQRDAEERRVAKALKEGRKP
jgi:hypothetical protein